MAVFFYRRNLFFFQKGNDIILVYLDLEGLQDPEGL